MNRSQYCKITTAAVLVALATVAGEARAALCGTSVAFSRSYGGVYNAPLCQMGILAAVGRRVSKAIGELEAVLGVRLFDRSAQGVELTLYGDALMKCGAVIFDELRQGIKTIEFLADPTSASPIS